METEAGRGERGSGSVTFATRISQVLVERERDQGYLISQLAAAALSRK